MTSKIYIVTDLGPGDGGKGGVVHKISTLRRAHTIIKVGGAQGSHGVLTSRGEKFAFSQWGCGTFEGTPTHISPRFVVSPSGLLNEAEALRYRCGIHDPFALLTVDEDALCATPYHGIASRLKEMSLGENPRGTIGTGIGEAYRDQERYPSLAIRMKDLVSPDLKERLEAVRSQVRKDLESILNSHFLTADQNAVLEERHLLESDEYLEYVFQRFREVAARTNIVANSFFGDSILPKEGMAVVESSHGVLTDQLYGFHPHTSALRTLPRFAEEMIRAAGYAEDVIHIGVSRGYQIRHGAGPLPTHSPGLSEHLLPGSHKDENRYQGKVRVGPLDLVLLRYAIEAAGGSQVFTGLAITWFDQLVANGEWQFCDRYEDPIDQKYFASAERVKLFRGNSEYQLAYQAALTGKLFQCHPRITRQALGTHMDQDSTYQLCNEVLIEKLSIPVRMVSFGPTEQHKLCK